MNIQRSSEIQELYIILIAKGEGECRQFKGEQMMFKKNKWALRRIDERYEHSFVKLLSHVQFFVTPRTEACQASPQDCKGMGSVQKSGANRAPSEIRGQKSCPAWGNQERLLGEESSRV